MHTIFRRHLSRAERAVEQKMSRKAAELSPRSRGIHEHRWSCLSAVVDLIHSHKRLDSAPRDITRINYLRGFKAPNRLDLNTSCQLLRTVDEMIAALPGYVRDDSRARELCQIVFDAPLASEA